jgi:hypothetical protein
MKPLSASFISSIICLETHQKIKNVSKERTVTSLWAGYGTISSVDVTISPENKKKSLIIKRVKPPLNDASVSNQRKIKSYHVEGFFYNTLAQTLMDLKQMDDSIPCRIATPFSIEKTKDPSSFTFVMEDLSDDYNESYSSSSSSMEQTKQAIHWLAVFHAAFFLHPHLVKKGTITSDGDGGRGKEDDDDNDNDANLQVWRYGGYWHLQTRLDEWESIPSYQSYIQKSAHAIDERMNEIGNGKSHTLVHGDYKDANIMFGSDDLDHCAVVDFQYSGLGYGAKDLVMWVVSSIPGKTFKKLGGEMGVLQMYHDALCENVQKIRKLGKVDWSNDDLEQFLNFDNIKMQYELALVDYVRFMAGWGFWGSNSGYAEERAKEILKEIAGSSDANMRKFSEDEWREAVYEKYPLDSF